MKRILSLIIIVFILGALVVPIIACNKDCTEHLDENGDNICDNCGETIKVEGDEPEVDTPSDDTVSDPEPEPVVPVMPVANYTREVVGEVTYIYYGSLPQGAVSKEVNNALSNLVSTNQIVPNEKGNYVYSDVEYACIVGNEQNEGRKLSNGLTIEKEGLYFFNIEKIKWRVLEEKDGKAVLFSEIVMDEYYFNPQDSYNSLGYLVGTQKRANDYAESALRTYVNDTLYNSIFTEQERASIYDTQVLNRPGESAFMETQGLATYSTDKMYLPSYWEINEKYNLKVKVEETWRMVTVEAKDYQLASGIKVGLVNGHYYSAWWLRTSGSKMNNGNIVDANGTLGTDSSCSINLSDLSGIRPCITIKTA